MTRKDLSQDKWSESVEKGDDRYDILIGIGESAFFADSYHLADDRLGAKSCEVARAVGRALLVDATDVERSAIRASYRDALDALDAETDEQSRTSSRLIEIGKLVVDERVRSRQYGRLQPPSAGEELRAYMDRKLSEFLDL
jgi:hypothetical protein